MAVVRTLPGVQTAVSPGTDPSSPSGDYLAMADYWLKVDTMLEGAGAMRRAGTTFLPQFPNEQDADYEYRRQTAKFTNIFADIISSLASKPFSEKCEVDEGTSDRIKALAEDIDGRGNNLHVFAAETFYGGIAYAIDWILVDYTKTAPNPDGRPLSQSQEAEQGARPYWVRVPATRMLAVYSAIIKGKEEFVHARMEENTTERNGFDENVVHQVRVFNREPVWSDDEGPRRVLEWGPPTFELHQKREPGDGAWNVIDAGTLSIDVIPVVPFITGRRKGASWQFVPPMRDAADLQEEHYQAETNLKSIKTQAAFPMLSASGVNPAKGADGRPLAVPIGPKAVLYAPPHPETGNAGEWKFIEPSANSLKFLAEDVANTEAQLRELGRQPLTATAGITVVVAGLASQKASSATQAWAFGLKDALEQGFRITNKWIKSSEEVIVKVHTDFAIDPNDEKGPNVLTEGRKNGDITRRTWWREMERRNILGPDFDPEEEEQGLEEERDETIEEDDMAAARMIEIQKAKVKPPIGAPPAPAAEV